MSGALFLTPGMCTILNWYRRVFSLRFLSLALLMWTRDLSPNIFRSGLWSTAMVRFLHPRTKCLALSRASTTASASPSIGAYLDSAACVNLLPTRVIFQPCLQQKRSWEGQEQCFWNNQYPMPCFDQSVARHVGLVLSKIFTPLWISSMMVSFDFSNACCSVSSQWNFLLGLSSSWKGNITSVMLNAYKTWFTKPNQDLTSVMFCGVGNSKMALMCFLHGLTESLVISKPANSTSFANLNFCGLRVILQICNQLAAWKTLSSIVSDHRRVSSTHLVLFGVDEMISSYLLVYLLPEAM